MAELPQSVLDLLYTKPGIGSCARRRLRQRLGLGKYRDGNKRRRLRVLRDQAFARQGGLCYYCKEPMVAATPDTVETPNMVTAEHLLPQSQGGATNEFNIVAACLRCNNDRGDRDEREFSEELRRSLQLSLRVGR